MSRYKNALKRKRELTEILEYFYISKYELSDNIIFH